MLHVAAILACCVWCEAIVERNRRLVREVRVRGNFAEVIAWQTAARRRALCVFAVGAALLVAAGWLIAAGVYK